MPNFHQRNTFDGTLCALSTALCMLLKLLSSAVVNAGWNVMEKVISSTVESWLHNTVVLDAGLGAKLFLFLDAVFFFFFALVP